VEGWEDCVERRGRDMLMNAIEQQQLLHAITASQNEYVNTKKRDRRQSDTGITVLDQEMVQTQTNKYTTTAASRSTHPTHRTIPKVFLHKTVPVHPYISIYNISFCFDCFCYCLATLDEYQQCLLM
jgi:hypothetical protein